MAFELRISIPRHTEISKRIFDDGHKCVYPPEKGRITVIKLFHKLSPIIKIRYNERNLQLQV